MKSESFVKKYLKTEVEDLLKSERYYPLLIYATLGIETLGAIIDDKPIRAKNQSKVRFGSALYHLFPNQYGFVNKGAFLYESLRNHSAHNLIPSSKIFFVDKDSKSVRHLAQQKIQVTFVIETFAKDFITACDLALDKIKNGDVKSKNIAAWE